MREGWWIWLTPVGLAMWGIAIWATYNALAALRAKMAEGEDTP